MCVSTCVCVAVCVREAEREREVPTLCLAAQTRFKSARQTRSCRSLGRHRNNNSPHTDPTGAVPSDGAVRRSVISLYSFFVSSRQRGIDVCLEPNNNKKTLNTTKKNWPENKRSAHPRSQASKLRGPIYSECAAARVQHFHRHPHRDSRCPCPSLRASCEPAVTVWKPHCRIAQRTDGGEHRTCLLRRAACFPAAVAPARTHSRRRG